MIITVMILLAAVIALALYLFLLKKDIRSIKEQLDIIQNTETNALLTTGTFDKDIIKLNDTINSLLKKRKSESLKLKKAEANMKQTITNISHDLRTPITSALGYIQLMDSGDISEDKRKEYLNIIEKKLKVLSAHAGQLFELSRILEGKSINPQKINVCNVLRDILAGFYDSFMQNGFEVKIEIPDVPIDIIADEEAVRRIFQNLSQNALVHGINRFQVKVDEAANQIIFSNQVKQEEHIDIDNLFERFYIGDLSRTSKSTGLGLAIAKTLTEEMGFTLSAEIREDVISFCVRLPNRNMPFEQDGI